MGQFDDLIAQYTPTANPGKPAGPFDDLIQQYKKPAKPPGMFDDLIAQYAKPDGRSKVELPPRSNAAKSPWDLFKTEKIDAVSKFTGDVGKGFGDKDVADTMLTESLPAHIIQGMKRDDGVSLDVDTSGGLIGTDTSKPAPKATGDKTDPGIIADLKALGVTAKEHPGLVVGSLVKSVVADPELLLPWLWEAIPEATAAKVAQAAKAMGASVDIAKAAEIGGRIAGRMSVGGAVSGTVEAGDQFSKGEFDAGRIGTAAAEGAAMSAPGRMVGKERPAVRGEAAAPQTPHDAAVDAGVAEPHQPLTPEEARTVAAIPDSVVTSMDTTRESLAQATREDPITPEMIAEVQREPIRPPSEARDRVVKAVKQAIVGGAVGGAIGYGVGVGKGEGEVGFETGVAIGAAFPLLKARKYLGADISELINARNGQTRAVARRIYQFQSQLEKAVPLKADREKIAEMIDHGVEPQAGTPEHDALSNLKAYFAQMGQLAKDAGVVNELRENYISHIVEDSPDKKTLLQTLFGGGEGAPAGGKSFGRERKYDTFEDLQAALKDSGLRLKTKDASEIAGIYGNAVYKSIADKRLLDALKSTKMPDGNSLVMLADRAGLKKDIPRAPRTYVRSDAPQLTGMAVHPDIAADLKFVFSTHNPNWLIRKLEQVTSIAKRIAVSTSLFHAKALAEGAIGAGLGKGLGRAMNAKEALRMFKEGGNNDTLDKLIKHGLMLNTPEDVAGHEIQHGLTRFAEVLDEKFPIKGVAKVARGLAAVDKAVERFTFSFLQTGFKINVASAEFERLIGKGVEEARAARLASSYTNDLFGSLDYYRVATDTDSHIMRKLGTASLNSNARKVLQLIMFAPDWTLATFRTMAKALPGGAMDPQAVQMHRRYLVKASLFYLTVANAVNYAQTGHSIFENKNPLRVELGDGRTMQFSKHDTEPMAWLQDPLGTGLGKGAFGARALVELYRSHTAAAMYHKPMPTPLQDAETVGSGMAPISLQDFIQNGLSMSAVAGALGFPIYGKSNEQKAEAKEKSRELRAAQ